MDWLLHGISLIFISLIDWMVYTLLSASYSVFLAVSKINLFATGSGEMLYNEITRQIYTIIGVAMIFVFAYQFLLLIINPDGNGKGSPTKLFKDTVISIVFIIVMPTIFNYMNIFQDHVLSNNTIPAIVLGTNASTDAGAGAGNKLAMMVYISFYHPQGTTYSTFYDTNGEVRDNYTSDCTDAEVCSTFLEAVREFEENYKISSITGVTSLRHAIDSDTGMSYLWIIAPVCGAFVIWFFISYTIDIGVRAVKLGFLQLIAPIPMIMRVFPGPSSKKSFETWMGELVKTYVEIFIRLAVIFFIVRICQLVPEFIDMIFSSDNNVSTSPLVKCIATVCLILGLLKFAKDAPDLFKALFSTNGGIFSGLNLKPGVAKRMEENTYGMKAIGAGLGAATGMIGAGVNSYKNAKAKNGDNVGKRFDAKALGAGIVGGARGMITGGKHGMKNQSEKFTAKDIMEAAYDASDVARNKVAKPSKLGKVANEIGGTIHRMNEGRKENGAQGVFESLKTDGEKLGKEIGKEIRKPFERITGVTGGGKELEMVGQFQAMMSNFKNMMEDDVTRNLDKQKETVHSNIGVAGGWTKQATFEYTAADFNADGEPSHRLENAINRAVAAGKGTREEIIKKLKDGGKISETRNIAQEDMGTAQFEEFAKEIRQQIDNAKAIHQAEVANDPEVKKMMQKQAADIEKLLTQNSAYFSEDTMKALSKGLNMSINDILKEVKKIKENGADVSIDPNILSQVTKLSENANMYAIAVKKEEAKKQKEGK